MLTQYKLTVSLALGLFTIPAFADPAAYVVNSFQFGTVDLSNGAFHVIGPGVPEGSSGLVQGPNGSLLTLTFSGDLDSINPSTGVASLVGATGLADCSTPASPCGPTSANTLGQMGGTIYATDFQNDLYTVNPSTGTATLIGPTGIPGIPFIPLSTNPDGSFNAYDESIFGAAGKLYVTFDTITVDPTTFAVTPAIAPDLYQINLATGLATLVAPTTVGLGAAVAGDGTVFAFSDSVSQVVAIDSSNGNTSFVSNFDPAAGIIDGAAPVPEPASIALTGVSLVAVMFVWRRRKHSK
jgi:hypothetical protein